jgi:hypothetical protein
LYLLSNIYAFSKMYIYYFRFRKKKIQVFKVWYQMPVIPAIQETESRKITVQDQPWQKANESPSSTKRLGMALHAGHLSYRGDRGRRTPNPGQASPKHETLPEK